MNIGDKFKLLCKRKKDEKTLVILHDYNTNRRFLWYIEGNIRIGAVSLLYKTEYLGKASKEEINKYYSKANVNSKTN